MFPDRYLQYNHPTSKSHKNPSQKPPKPHSTASTTAPMPHPPTTHPPQRRCHLPAHHHTSHPQKPERTDCQRDGCMVGTRCVGVSRWSYLAPEASDGKVLCGHKPQSKPHLSEPGTHQRTWRVMGRPARQKTQTLSMTRRNDRTRHDHAAAPPAVRPSLPPSHPQKRPKKGPKNEECPGSGLPGDYYEKIVCVMIQIHTITASFVTFFRTIPILPDKYEQTMNIS